MFLLGMCNTMKYAMNLYNVAMLFRDGFLVPHIGLTSVFFIVITLSKIFKDIHYKTILPFQDFSCTIHMSF